MDVQVVLVGSQHYNRVIKWPAGWPVPPVGSEITVPEMPVYALSVRSIIWYPEGDPELTPDERKPFVYMVVGLPRARIEVLHPAYPPGPRPRG